MNALTGVLIPDDIPVLEELVIDPRIDAVGRGAPFRLEKLQRLFGDVDSRLTQEVLDETAVQPSDEVWFPQFFRWNNYILTKRSAEFGIRDRGFDLGTLDHLLPLVSRTPHIVEREGGIVILGTKFVIEDRTFVPSAVFYAGELHLELEPYDRPLFYDTRAFLAAI